MTLDIVSGTYPNLRTLASCPILKEAAQEFTIEAPIYDGRSLTLMFAYSPNKGINANSPSPQLPEGPRARLARYPRLCVANSCRKISSVMRRHPPSASVPAITPEARGAKTIRDLMKAPTSEERCAECHRKLDPIGFVLENYDAMGQRRDVYPSTRPAQKVLPLSARPLVDAAATMPAGNAGHFESTTTIVAACLMEGLLISLKLLRSGLMTRITAERHSLT